VLLAKWLDKYVGVPASLAIRRICIDDLGYALFGKGNLSAKETMQ